METFRSLRKEGVTAGNFRRPLHSFEAPNSNLGLRAEFALLVLSDIVEKKAPFVAEVAARKGKYELAMTACKVCTN
ncbi:uncharacterized protein [Physcomitrium patens]|uniref:uncharacterized protein isoform X4 n=1 Tax=Physcomitrium patens TaxID=3218 RepID=UPI003CCD9880